MANTDKRFIVVYGDEAEKYEDPECHVWDEFEPASYLVDTKINQIVFSDRMEPEDATLGRSLLPLIDLLNIVASDR